MKDRGYTNENIGPGSQNIRGKMGGTAKSFGMKLDKIHTYEERPGPQNYSPVEINTLSKFRKDGETVFGGEVRGN